MTNWYIIKKAFVHAIITVIAVFLIVKIVFNPTNPPDNRYFMYLLFFIVTICLGFVYIYKLRVEFFLYLSLGIAFYIFILMIQPHDPHWVKVYPTHSGGSIIEEPTGEEPYWMLITETGMQGTYHLVLLFMFGYYLLFYWLAEKEKDRQDLDDWLHGRRKI